MNSQEPDSTDKNKMVNPFPGLRYYETEEWPYYYIEPKKQNDLLLRLFDNNFLVVAGKPGSGKASLLNCGIIPRLAQGFMGKAGDKWTWAIFRPGTNPIRNLAENLARCGIFLDGGRVEVNFADRLEEKLRGSSDGLINIFNEFPTKQGVNLFLAVDELEDIFILNELIENDEDINAFINLLLRFLKKGHPYVYMMWALDSHFLGDSAKYPGLPEAINRGQYLLIIADHIQLKKLIKHAFKAASIDIEPGVIEHTLARYNEHTHVYLLQHMLKRFVEAYLDDEARPKKIDITYYDQKVESLETLKAGETLEASNVIEVHAEQIYNNFSKRAKLICQTLFKVITKDINFGVDRSLAITVLRLAKIAECSVDEMISVIGEFSKQELYIIHIVGADEIAGRLEALGNISGNAFHELTPYSKIMLLNPVFVKIWHRLERWQREEREDAEIYLRLTEAEERYTSTAGSKQKLYNDPELAEAIRWRDEGFHNLEWSSRYAPTYEAALFYLKKSEEQRKFEKANLEKETQRKEKLRFWISRGLIAACVIFLGLACWAVIEQTRAKQAKRLAETEKEHVNYIQDLDSIHTIYIDALEDISSAEISILIKQIGNPTQGRTDILKFADDMIDRDSDCKEALRERLKLLTNLKNKSSQFDNSDDQVGRWRLHKDSLQQHNFCIVINDHCSGQRQYINLFNEKCLE